MQRPSSRGLRSPNGMLPRRIRRRAVARPVAALCFALLFCLAPRPTRANDPATPAPEETDEQQASDHAHEHEHGEAHDEMENIVITASPLAHRADELAVPVDRLRRDEIIEQLGATLGDTLRNVPGVASTGFAGGASRPVIRGQDAFRTEVLEGGLSTQDVSRLSPDHAVPINPLAAQTIEVVRGPAILRYGGGASAGVVNAITNRVPLERSDAPVQAEAVGIYGSNGDQGDVAAVVDGGFSTAAGDFAWHVDGLYTRADDYETGAGTVQEGTNREGYAVSAGSSYFFDGGRLGFAYARFDNDYGIPEEEPVQIAMRTNRYRFEGDLDTPVRGLRSIKLRGVYSDYTHDEEVAGIPGQTFNNDELDARVELLHERWLGFIGAAGFYVRHQDLSALGEAEEFLAPSKTKSFAFYFFEERPLADTLDLELGLRTEGTWVSGTPITGLPRERGFAPISGAAALVANPWDGWTLAATGTAGQRAPSQVELFARGPHEATATFEVGNANFNEETSYTGELRIEGQVQRLELQGSAFATYYDDFIYGQETGRTVDADGTPDPGGEFEELFYVARNALFYGGEIALGGEIFDLWDGVLRSDWQLDFVRARFTAGPGNKNVPRITPLRWGGSLSYERDRISGRIGFLRSEAQWYPAPSRLRKNAVCRHRSGFVRMFRSGSRAELRCRSRSGVAVFARESSVHHATSGRT
jgi:iron complex outermembrane receptor protein